VPQHPLSVEGALRPCTRRAELRPGCVRHGARHRTRRRDAWLNRARHRRGARCRGGMAAPSAAVALGADVGRHQGRGQQGD
jgi:hypothetical protein